MTGPCPINERRAGMSDEEYWSDVMASMGYPDFDEPDFDEPEVASLDGEPCPLCGEANGCAYDSEGRTLIHVITGTEADQ